MLPPNGVIERKYTAENDYLIDRVAQKGMSYSGITDFRSQDMMATESAGPIYDRTSEHLGSTDVAVIRMHRMLIRAAKALADYGELPPALGGSGDFRAIRGAEKILAEGEDWRALGTNDDPAVTEAELSAPGGPPPRRAPRRPRAPGRPDDRRRWRRESLKRSGRRSWHGHVAGPTEVTASSRVGRMGRADDAAPSRPEQRLPGAELGGGRAWPSRARWSARWTRSRRRSRTACSSRRPTSCCTATPTPADAQVLGGAGFPTTSAQRLASMLELRRARRGVQAPGGAARPAAGRVPHRYESVMRDPRWAPAHRSLDSVDWDGFAVAPLESRGRVVGTLSAFYPSGLTPAGRDEVERLAAVADQAAIAVDNAGLLAKTRRWAVAQERNRLGRELHDAIVQDVFSLAVHSRTIQVSAEAGGPGDVERIRAGAAELIELSRSALTALRALIFELRPPALQDHSLSEAVRAYAASMTGRSGVPIAVTDERADTWLPEVASDHIYRVVQESLHNVARHAGASRVTVSFRDGGGAGRAGAEVIVEIADDGRGFDPGLVGDGHFGLITMRERAEDLGGFLEVRSCRGAGTRVILRVPRSLLADPSPEAGPSPETGRPRGIGQPQ